MQHRVYIAGPMTGFPQYNVAAFAAAAADWRAEGWDAVTPFDCNSVVWRKHYGRDFDPAVDVCDWGDPILSEMFAEDVATLCAADAIAFLPGWRKSKGATLEHALASALGKPLHDAATFGKLTDETVCEEAQRLVGGDRGASYGHPLDDYTRTAAMWSAILGHDVTAEQAILCMIAVKLSREAHKPKRDNRTDMAGYAQCLDMVNTERARRE